MWGCWSLYEQEGTEKSQANPNEFDPSLVRVSGEFLAREVEGDDVIAGVIGGTHLAVRERGERPGLGWSWAVLSAALAREFGLDRVS